MTLPATLKTVIQRTAKLSPLFLRFVSVFSAYLLSAVVARKLGIDKSGHYFFCLNVLSIITTISCLGYTKVVVRESASLEGKFSGEYAFLTKNILLSIVISLICCAAVYVMLPSMARFFGFDYLSEFMKPLLISSPFIALITIVSYYLLAKNFQNTFVILSSLAIPTGVLICIFIYDLNFSQVESKIVWIYSLVQVAVGLTAMTLVLRFWWQSQVVDQARELSTKGWPSLWGTDLLSIIIVSGTLMIVAKSITPADYSALSVIIRISAVITVLFASVNNMMLPKMAIYIRENRYNELFQYVIGFMKPVVLVVALILISCWAGGQYLLVMFGTAFADYHFYLICMMCFVAIGACLGPCQSILTLAGKEKYVVRATMIGAFSGVVLSMVLPEYFAVMGAVVAIGLTSLLVKVLMFFMVYEMYLRGKKNSEI